VNFTSPTFLLLFFPIVIIVNLLIKKTQWSNLFLLLVSLFFYAWGETVYLLLLLFSIALNYFGGRIIANSEDLTKRRLYLGVFVAINLVLLGYFKYFAFFLDLFTPLGLSSDLAENIYLPLGISFFTFQAISYLVDLYYEKVTLLYRCFPALV